ncbi:hypothetical protein RN001_001576 [Aquatica leii]|uniref:Major facilitator superfamily (MFS) profile domain-containing protein n=1 Tax=Aquatica leii TaxID=1421715 RepID=A0AAN7QAH5_9COLE|nr:hypothetical protein RN001_001576 [Aquatica leii]
MTYCSLKTFKFFVEIPVLLLSFAVMFETTISTHLILFRTCYVTLGYNRSNCVLLGTGREINETALLEKMVQPYASILLMVQSCMHAFIMPIFCFYLGSSSDKFGRKPILLACFGGFIGCYIIMTIISMLPQTSPWYILISLIPVCISGGFPLVITTVISYITDITEEHNRGIRMGSCEAAFTIGVLLGTFCSSFALNAFGFTGIYITCMLCSIIAWFFILFLIPESKTNLETEDKIISLFKLSLVQKTLKLTFEGRNLYDKMLIIFIVVLMLLFTIARFSDHCTLFLYLRQTFGWSLKRFTLYMAFKSIVIIVGSIIGAVVLNKLLHVRETIVLIIGFFTTMCSYLLLGLAKKNWEIYLAGCFKGLCGAVNPMARLLLSKLISKKDIGKVFGLVVAMETVSGHVGNSIFTYIYNRTLAQRPSTFCFVTAGFYVLEVFITLVIMYMHKQHRKGYHKIDSEEATRESSISE